MRTGLAWSDSSRMSSSQGSFLARICAAICSITLDGETWWGRAVTMMFAPSRA